MSSTLRAGGTLFAFYPIPPNSGIWNNKKNNENLIQFRALITNISDSSSPQWGESLDMGRADPKYMYQSYSRVLTIEFMTAALYKDEHWGWLNTLNSLVEMTKPIYKNNLGYNGIYTQMIVGELYNEIGVLQSVDFTINNETPWKDDIPMYIQCSLSLKVIGKNKPNYKKNSGNLGTRPNKTGKFKYGEWYK